MGSLGLVKVMAKLFHAFFILYSLFHKPQLLKILDHDNNLAYFGGVIWSYVFYFTLLSI